MHPFLRAFFLFLVIGAFKYGCEKEDAPGIQEIPDEHFCILPFPPDYLSVDTTGCPHLVFATDCSFSP